MGMGLLDVATGPIGASNFGDSFFGQSQTPDLNNPSAAQILKKTRNNVPAVAGINTDFNNIIGPAYANLGRNVENIYDPNQGALRGATTSRLLDEVNNPYSLPPELAQLFKQSANQTRGATGLGASEAGRFNMLKTLGLDTLQFGENRINRAASFTRSAPLPNQLFQPITSLTPADAAGLTVAGNNQANQQNIYRTDIANTNTRNLIDVPLGRAETAWSSYIGAGGGSPNPAQQGMPTGQQGSSPYGSQEMGESAYPWSR